MEPNPINNVELFKSVLTGREDVFAIQWEKGSKSAYMPAYLMIHFSSGAKVGDQYKL